MRSAIDPDGRAPCQGNPAKPLGARLRAWLSDGTSATFPCIAVSDHVRRNGKAHLSPEFTEILLVARERLRREGSGAQGAPRIEAVRFLDVVLDLRDRRYDYNTYLALELLPLHREQLGFSLVGRDRCYVRLLNDLSRFERAAAEAPAREPLPDLRPDRVVVSRRLRIIDRLIGPPSRRLDAVTAPRCVPGPTSVDDWLRLTLLPVHTCHDEWLFLRVLQSFEVTFLALAELVAAAESRMTELEPHAAARLLRESALLFREALPLLSLLNTMSVEAFRTFRTFTAGASAIQSSAFKRFEATCAAPAPSRVDGPAFRSVPTVRSEVLSGMANFVTSFGRRGELSPEQSSDVVSAMADLDATYLKWKRAHVHIAEKYLGNGRGTGYTEGVAYLRRSMREPLFETRSLMSAGRPEMLR